VHWAQALLAVTYPSLFFLGEFQMSDMRSAANLPTCPVRREPVRLEAAKDTAIRREGGAMPPIEKSVSAEVIDFLISAKTPAADARCPECGSPIEHRTCTFFFGGQTWDVPLPFCPACHPVSLIPVHHA